MAIYLLNITMRDDSVTPGVKDVIQQVKDPQSPGSRGLRDQVERKLKGHTMRDLLDIVDKNEKTQDNASER